MRKQNGTIRKRTPGVWEGRFYLNGERQCIYGKTYNEVRRRLTQATSQIDDGTFMLETDHTVASWIDEWFTNFVDIKTSTRVRYERDIRLYILPAIGHMKLKDVSSVDLQHLYRKLITKGLSPKSVHNLHGIIHEALSCAVRIELIKKNVSDQCILPKLRKVEMHPLSDEQVSLLLRLSQDDEFADEIFFALFTGLRESEVVGLTWDCIDFSRGSVRVYRQYVRISSGGGSTSFAFTSCKNDRERIIIPGETVMARLKQIQQCQRLAQIRAGSSWHNSDGFVFTRSDGRPVQYQAMYKHLKKLVALIGSPETRFHDLRHTYATLSLQEGADVKTLSASLGHATVAFTLDRYGHISSAMSRDHASRMDSLIARL